jgi:RHH-type proline utilization regulon transcriptional repressor/proline dehydrogenase/delta 1-pyrroline-5-carboxylate dehydrogenase
MNSPEFPAPSPALETAIRTKGEQLFALMDQQPPPARFSK